MNANELYNYNRKELKLAFKYFPNFTIYWLSSRNKCNKEEYLNRLKKIVNSKLEIPNIETTMNKEISELKEAFQYLSIIIKNDNEPNFNKTLIELLRYSYNDLILEISSYKFVTKSDKSIGKRQTLANREILIDILSLQETFMFSLKIIDDFLKIDNKEIEISNLQNHITNKLEESISYLANIYNKVSTSRKDYHETWNNYAGRNYNITVADTSSLGSKKDTWRLDKNEACRGILNIYMEIDIIIEKISDFIEQKEECNTINFSFHRGITNIINGPNYYSYLTKEEIEDQTKENKEKKLEMKKK